MEYLLLISRTLGSAKEAERSGEDPGGRLKGDMGG